MITSNYICVFLKSTLQESLKIESSNPPPFLQNTEHLKYVMHCITSTVHHFPNQMLPPAVLEVSRHNSKITTLTVDFDQKGIEFLPHTKI